MKINKTKFQTLIREIIEQTLQYLNESENGEWWIYPDGSTEFADGDLGDSNHEAHVIRYLCHEIYEHFIGNAGDELEYLSAYEEQFFEVLKDSGRLTEEDIEEWQRGGGPTEIIIKKLLEDKVYKDEAQTHDAVYLAWGSTSRDARDYGMKYLGWKRMTTRGNSTAVQTWTLSQNDLDTIKKGIYDAWGNMGDMGNDEEDLEHKVEIEIRANNKSFHDIPLDIFDKASVRTLIPYMKQYAWMRERKQKVAPVIDPVNFTKQL